MTILRPILSLSTALTITAILRIGELHFQEGVVSSERNPGSLYLKKYSVSMRRRRPQCQEVISTSTMVKMPMPPRRKSKSREPITLPKLLSGALTQL